MGLDFSHCNARWAYSGFNRFRNRVAVQIGFPEYENIKTTDDPKFSKIKDDPIVYLLAHSDCDGELSPTQCIELAPRLREIIKDWPEDDYDRRQALELASGMELAAKSDESLLFE